MLAERPSGQWAVGVFLILISLGACGWMLWEVWHEGDRMIGFLFVLILYFAVPTWGIIALISLAAGLARKWRLFLLSSIAAVLPLALLFYPVNLPVLVRDWSWQYGISLNDRATLLATNVPAIESLSEGPGLYEAKNLELVPEFHWHGEHDTAAPDGVFYGFRYNGSLHIRVQKIRHGWRGLALIDESQSAPNDPEEWVRYEYDLAPGWWVWTSGQPPPN